MPRYRLDIEYDGTGYAGWQRQDDHPSIQQAIETAIKGFCGETVASAVPGGPMRVFTRLARLPMSISRRPGRTTRCVMPSTHIC
jgi:tRNA pseudouridine(38-40) synthase